MKKETCGDDMYIHGDIVTTVLLLWRNLIDESVDRYLQNFERDKHGEHNNVYKRFNTRDWLYMRSVSFVMPYCWEIAVAVQM